MSAINEIKEWLNEKEGKAFLKDYFKDMEKGSTPETGKDYTNSFYNIIGYLSWIFLILGILSAVLIFFSTGDIFKALAVIFLLVWLIVFLRYFVWAVYHYNINYGITSNDWVKIAEAREKKLRGEEVDDTETEEPAYNPYRSQTFGLPPGTVRGMIAFTLLFGSITILVASMGMDAGDLQNSLIRDQFEFFKTAFLMMIAFYFGDKSLKFLQKRWKNPNGNTEQGGTESETASTPNTSETKNDLDSDDEDFKEQDREFGKTEEPENAPSKSPTTILKNAMHIAIKPDKGSVAEKKSETLQKEYPHVADTIHSKVLSDEQIKEALADLQEKDGIQLQFPVLKAIIEVESGGSGHLSDGRAKILFEGHKFWYWLTKLGLDPEAHRVGNENILYSKWTRKFYRGGAKEYFRFDQARQINEKAAIYSTSWGLFQILGENLEHNIKSRLNPDKKTLDEFEYFDVFDFVEKQHKSEYYHLLDFLAFVKTKQLKGKSLIDFVSGSDESLFDWEKFAYGYNGSGYKKNLYDEKLKRAYLKYSNML
ncbi:MAG: N-acetylmuramidase family protein [Bacteroidales bacterium]|nr:N-acetylmuramidase family protein [Bacteroidales bacterium]MCF8458434.1 N-acetylmuramidase family protein [Bacteroidales bacterium]